MSWDVYKIARKAVWLGAIEVPDKQAAVEKAVRNSKRRCGVCTRCGSRCPLIEVAIG
jgi:hypothetical protein